MTENLSSFLPLSPAALHILVALASEDRHGYAIMQDVARQSEGNYKISPGTLYDNLQKLVDRGIIDQVPRPSKNDDPRRLYYGLTAFGRRVLAAEIARLEAMVREARPHLRTPAVRSRW